MNLIGIFSIGWKNGDPVGVTPSESMWHFGQKAHKKNNIDSTAFSLVEKQSIWERPPKKYHMLEDSMVSSPLDLIPNLLAGETSADILLSFDVYFEVYLNFSQIPFRIWFPMPEFSWSESKRLPQTTLKGYGERFWFFFLVKNQTQRSPEFTWVFWASRHRWHNTIRKMSW